MERQVKQIIVIRKDLKMRRGKEIAQGAHASMGALLSLFGHYSSNPDQDGLASAFVPQIYGIEYGCYGEENPVMKWLNGSFAKITVTVQTEEELINLHTQVKKLGYPTALIQDNGKTEFHGIKTYTALGIGPWWSDEIDKITRHLELY